MRVGLCGWGCEGGPGGVGVCTVGSAAGTRPLGTASRGPSKRGPAPAGERDQLGRRLVHANTELERSREHEAAAKIGVLADLVAFPAGPERACHRSVTRR